MPDLKLSALSRLNQGSLMADLTAAVKSLSQVLLSLGHIEADITGTRFLMEYSGVFPFSDRLIAAN